MLNILENWNFGIPQLSELFPFVLILGFQILNSQRNWVILSKVKATNWLIIKP